MILDWVVGYTSWSSEKALSCCCRLFMEYGLRKRGDKIPNPPSTFLITQENETAWYKCTDLDENTMDRSSSSSDDDETENPVTSNHVLNVGGKSYSVSTVTLTKIPVTD